jgi:hypothetical protein
VTQALTTGFTSIMAAAAISSSSGNMFALQPLLSLLQHVQVLEACNRSQTEGRRREPYCPWSVHLEDGDMSAPRPGKSSPSTLD